MENTKDLNYYKNNCEEDYINTPISVLRYITELEQALQLQQNGVSGSFFSVCYSTNEGLFFVDEEENQTKLKEKAKKFKSRKEAEMYINKELCGFGNVLHL